MVKALLTAMASWVWRITRKLTAILQAFSVIVSERACHWQTTVGPVAETKRVTVKPLKYQYFSGFA